METNHRSYWQRPDGLVVIVGKDPTPVQAGNIHNASGRWVMRLPDRVVDLKGVRMVSEEGGGSIPDQRRDCQAEVSKPVDPAYPGFVVAAKPGEQPDFVPVPGMNLRLALASRILASALGHAPGNPETYVTSALRMADLLITKELESR